MRERVAKWLRSLRSLYIDIPVLRPGTVGAYILAIVAVGVATVLRLVLDPYIEGAQFLTFYPAVVITTLISGFGAGFLCTVLSTAAVDFFVLEPRFSFLPESSLDLVSLLVFGPFASYLVIIIARMRYAIEAEQVEAGKNRLQLALDAAQLGWWQYDLSGQVASGDSRFKEILDVAVDVLRIDDLKNRLHPDDAERFWADRDVALHGLAPQRPAPQYRVRRRDGEVRWIEVHRLVHFETADHHRRLISLIGTVQDVTERKDDAEKLRLLMREVNHRARNMLSVVDAIAHQTVASNPEDYVGRFSDRIRALAVYQDLLVRSEWKGVEIEDLVRAQRSDFAVLVDSRITMQGPKLRLNPASAQVIGLALHELTTNAEGYGALSTDKGRVEVGWGTEGDTFTMNWTEHDGPPVSPPQRRGFGSTVMTTMTERTVDGKVELDYAFSGVTWRLTCPAVNALESWEVRGEETTSEQPTSESPAPLRDFQPAVGSAANPSLREHYHDPRVEGT